MIFRIVLCIALLLFPPVARAESISLIQDEETERVLASFLIPLFKTAGLNPDEMKIHLVKDDSINAFAAKGLHVFIHTGLLTKADNAQEVVAVLAHETGHIAGGHIVRLYDNIRIAKRNMLLSMLLAGIAGVASRRGDVGMAAMMGAQTSAQSLLMGYRRTEENAADQFAVSLLAKTGHGIVGFEEMMKKLRRQEDYQIDPKTDIIWQTHPDVRDRLAFIVDQKDKIPPENKRLIARENKAFKNVQAKLYAFLYDPAKTFAKFPESDTSFPARYARAVATYRASEYERAVADINALIKEFPENPYLYELKGQISFETGKNADAIKAYKTAVRLLPDAALFRIGLAQAQTESDKREDWLDALDTLRTAGQYMADSPFIWRLFAVAYGKTGQYPMADYALAEYNFHISDDKQAAFFAQKALKELPESAAAAQKARDILDQATKKHSLKKR